MILVENSDFRIYKVWCAKTRMMWLPTAKKSVRISVLVLIQYTNVTDSRTDGQTNRYCTTA